MLLLYFLVFVRIFFLMRVLRWWFEFRSCWSLLCFFVSLFCLFLIFIFFNLVKWWSFNFRIVFVCVLFKLNCVINFGFGLLYVWIILIILLIFKNVINKFFKICKCVNILFKWYCKWCVMVFFWYCSYLDKIVCKFFIWGWLFRLIMFKLIW